MEPAHPGLPRARHCHRRLLAHQPRSLGGAAALPAPEALALTDFRRMSPRFAEPANLEANKAKVAVVERVAHRLGATPAQEALAWLHAKGPNVFPIPGSVNPARIAENVTATSLRLALEDVAELDAIGEGPGEVRRRRRRRAAAAEAAHPTEDRRGRARKRGAPGGIPYTYKSPPRVYR